MLWLLWVSWGISSFELCMCIFIFIWNWYSVTFQFNQFNLRQLPVVTQKYIKKRLHSLRGLYMLDQCPHANLAKDLKRTREIWKKHCRATKPYIILCLPYIIPFIILCRIWCSSTTHCMGKDFGFDIRHPSNTNSYIFE